MQQISILFVSLFLASGAPLRKPAGVVSPETLATEVSKLPSFEKRLRRVNEWKIAKKSEVKSLDPSGKDTPGERLALDMISLIPEKMSAASCSQVYKSGTASIFPPTRTPDLDDVPPQAKAFYVVLSALCEMPAYRIPYISHSSLSDPQ
jgi:hypothetical protein